MSDISVPVPAVVTPGGANMPEEPRRAAVTVAGHWTDVDDCRELLDMLGLLDEMPPAL